MPWSRFVLYSSWLSLISLLSLSLTYSCLYSHSPSTCFFPCSCLSLMHLSTGERQEWMETLQTAKRPPACGSQKPSDSLSHPSSTNKRGLLELRGYKGRVVVSLAGSKVRLCKTEQVLPAPLGLPLYKMTASCLKKDDNNHSLFEADEIEMEMFMNV